MSTTETKVKERPILFSGPMVRAILEGRKTQTRRILKPQPTEKPEGRWSWIVSSSERSETGKFQYSWPDPDGNAFTIRGREQAVRYRCPYGRVGERLWVRETCWCDGCTVYYTADSTYQSYSIEDRDTEERLQKLHHYANGIGEKVPSIHMPRWASRITLEITGVRAERLNDISEADALAEGCDGNCQIGYIPAYQAGPCSYHFAQLWESINGVGSWKLNPFVWVIEFKPIKSL